MTANQNPEQHARNRIDEQLRQTGWAAQQAKNEEPATALLERIRAEKPLA